MEQQEAAAVGSGTQTAAAGRVLVDLSDLLMYLHHHSTVTGIQRVIVQVVPGLVARRNCQFVAYSPRSRHFVLLERSAASELLESLRNSTEGDRARITELVRSLAASVDNAPAYRGEPGDVLAILGAAWIYEGFFKAVMDLKRAGVGVAALLYDLIPVIYPGFPHNSIAPFRQYLARIAFLADRVPAISRSARSDFEEYCRYHGWEAPPGGATTLAADQWPSTRGGGEVERAWPRPFVLFVGTIEARKNHVLALRAWRRLILQHGRDAVPDLVCVGRIGWNCFEFLEEYYESDGLDGKVALLSDSVSDDRLAALYRDCEFTVYPSRYEGWGLPVTESLMAGKPVVTARNSSLSEAGGDVATFFEDNNIDGFIDCVQLLLTGSEREAATARILADYRPPTWDHISGVILTEIDAAAVNPRPFLPRLDLGKEYGLGFLEAYGGDHDGTRYLQFLEESRRLPLTGQLQDPLRVVMADLMLSGHLEAPTSRGRPITAGHGLVLRLPRPSESELHLVVAIGESGGPVRLRVTGPAGLRVLNLPPAGAFSVRLGEGGAGDWAQVDISTEATEDVVVASFCVVDSKVQADLLVQQRLGWASARAAAEARRAVSSAAWQFVRPVQRGRQYARGMKGRVKRRVMATERGRAVVAAVRRRGQ